MPTPSAFAIATACGSADSETDEPSTVITTRLSGSTSVGRSSWARMTSVGFSPARTMRSVTLPISQRPTPERPCVAMATSVPESLDASFIITSSGEPSRRAVSTFSPSDSTDAANSPR